MSTSYELIGKRIQAVRKRRGLSQMMLSEKVDRSPGFMSYIENGVKKMSLETFIEIANALNSSADELLVDCIENTIMASNHAFVELASDCSDYEVRVLIDIMTAAKAALREHAPYFRTRYR